MKKKTARSLALLMAAAMAGTTFFGTGVPVAQAAGEWIGDGELEDNSTAAPAPDEVLPNKKLNAAVSIWKISSTRPCLLIKTQHCLMERAVCLGILKAD